MQLSGAITNHAISQEPTTRAWVAVNLDNLVTNARAIACNAGRNAALLPVIKADAYGLGAVEVAKALRSQMPWGFAVATVEEGMRLRAAEVHEPVLVFTPAFDEQRSTYARHRLTAVLDEASIAQNWEIPFHAEIDTGMGRSGVRWDDHVALKKIAAARPEGAFTHFHSADAQPDSVNWQLERFRSALSVFDFRPSLLHAANSAAAWRCRDALNLIRPGIFLYGGRPAADLPSPLPVVAVRTHVVSLRSVKCGESISYGATWTASHDTVVATLGIGYADGLSHRHKAKPTSYFAVDAVRQSGG